MKARSKVLLLLPALIVGIGWLLTNRLNAQTLTTLHTFATSSFTANLGWTNSDGAWPENFTGLVLSSNMLYGTTSSGGPNGGGTVFTINTDGSGFKTLHFFTGSDGASPNSLILSGIILKR